MMKRWESDIILPENLKSYRSKKEESGRFLLDYRPTRKVIITIFRRHGRNNTEPGKNQKTINRSLIENSLIKEEPIKQESKKKKTKTKKKKPEKLETPELIEDDPQYIDLENGLQEVIFPDGSRKFRHYGEPAHMWLTLEDARRHQFTPSSKPGPSDAKK